jgi:RNA polymerase sigma factor (sigma-70 family)
MFPIVHLRPLNGPAAYVCAQSGCQACVEHLMRQHAGLAHLVLRRQHHGGLAYEDLLQEGRIALWQAVLHFDPHRGIAFSTYAGVAIERRIWRAVAQSNRSQGWLPSAPPPNPLQEAEERLWRAQVRIVLAEAVCRLPNRLQQVIVAAYGLGGEPPRSLAAIGREFGVTREAVRHWRNDALLLLRLPAISGRLRGLYGQDSRAAYVHTQALNRAWLRQKRGRQP